MRSFLVLLVTSVLFLSGCSDRAELSSSTYGTILKELPELQEAEEPFVFPVDGDDHTDCTFNEEDYN